MRLIVDTNVWITFFWRISISKELFSNQALELATPEYALKELMILENVIREKAGISKEEFSKTLREVQTLVKVIPLKTYRDFIHPALKISPDPDDVDFFAAALSLSCPLWSNDKQLQNQKKVVVLTTKNIIEVFDE